MTPKDLSALLKVCLKYGVKRLKVDSFEVELGDAPQELHQALLEGKESIIGGISDKIELPNAPSEEDLLYWSTQTQA